MKKRFYMILLVAVLGTLLFAVPAFAAESKDDVNLKNFKMKTPIKVMKKEINGKKYVCKTHDKITLTWGEVDGADYYNLYKYNDDVKKYQLYGKVPPEADHFVVSGLKPLTTYKFKMSAVSGEMESERSNPLKVKTRSITDGYFYEMVVWDETWPGVLITYEKASNAVMDDLSFVIKNRIEKSSVKYNYATKNNTLYIHAYMEFEGPGADENFTYYSYSNGTYKKGKTTTSTYKSLTINGIKECWETTVKGNEYNFIPGCNFKTRVILHTKDLSSDQRKVTVKIGSEDSYKNGYYWSFASGSVKGNYRCSVDKRILLATQEQLIQNSSRSRGPKKTAKQYKWTAAHEFGHILGLDDAYEVDENGATICRITETKETGYWKNGTFVNIMLNSYKFPSVVDNDIEMILQAQGMCLNEEEKSFQSYKTYMLNDVTYGMSPVIKL